MFQLLIFILFGYFLGSIPFGKIMGLRQGIDIQKHGSGNIGFANCLRILGLKPAIVVLIGDILKGFIPVYIAIRFLPFELIMFVALSAIVGHVFPIWLKFKGGKGIATGLGVLLAINPLFAFFCMMLWLLFFTFTKLNSLASILMIISIPLIAIFIANSLVPFSTALLAIGTWTHRKNIDNLLKRKEKKLF